MAPSFAKDYSKLPPLKRTKKKTRDAEATTSALPLGEKLLLECMKYPAEIDNEDAKGIKRLLLPGMADVNYARPDGGWRGVHLVAYNGAVKACRVLLKAKAKVNVTNDVGSTPLHLASACGHLEMVGWSVRFLAAAAAAATRASHVGGSSVARRRAARAPRRASAVTGVVAVRTPPAPHGARQRRHIGSRRRLDGLQLG
jgi:hypothetical protein